MQQLLSDELKGLILCMVAHYSFYFPRKETAELDINRIF